MEEQTHFHFVWSVILLEEVGEVAKAILEADWDQMRAELIQCAAVLVSCCATQMQNNGDRGGRPLLITTMGIEKVNREGERLPTYRLANSYGTGINAVTPEKSDKVVIYIDEADGNILETPICIVFPNADEVETFVEDLKEQARAVWG